MMRLCPKCRTFYDDADLRFCPNDGVPLVAVNEKSELWTEGTESIQETKNLIRRETRTRQIKKIVTVLITAILIVMIISVITINGWLYFNPKEEEIVRNEFPSPTVSPIFKPTAKPVPTIIETVSPTPTPTPTEVCSKNEQMIESNQISSSLGGIWRERFLADGDKIKQGRMRELEKNCDKFSVPVECKYFIEKTETSLGKKAVSQNVNVANDCKTATATVSFEWNIVTPQFPRYSIKTTKKFLYRKQNNGWRLVKIL